MLPQFVVSSQSNLFQSAKVLISTQAEAQDAGRQDAGAGLPCNTSRYAFADANSIAGSRLSGDYTFSYVLARGL